MVCPSCERVFHIKEGIPNMVCPLPRFLRSRTDVQLCSYSHLTN
jgi:uncharacterized protein YbaR (Trm112 family)